MSEGINGHNNELMACSTGVRGTFTEQDVNVSGVLAAGQTPCSQYVYAGTRNVVITSVALGYFERSRWPNPGVRDVEIYNPTAYTVTMAHNAEGTGDEPPNVIVGASDLVLSQKDGVRLNSMGGYRCELNRFTLP